jgi:cyanophycinase
MHQLFLVTALLGQGLQDPAGYLVIVGGGPTTTEIIKKTLALAGGKKAHVLILPFASGRTNAGQLSQEMWRKAGAEKASILDIKDKKAALAAIKDATLIWMPGGSQSLLMRKLNEGGVIGAIRDRFRKGATVGGTSAGAAVMSLIMLTGETKRERNTSVFSTAEGLGLWPGVIIDQHYHRQYRFSRLLSAVLSHPKMVGIGINECTAVVVKGRSFEVVGKSNVYVIDARKASQIQIKNGEPGSAANVSLQVLKPGMRYSLDKGILSQVVKRKK